MKNWRFVSDHDFKRKIGQFLSQKYFYEETKLIFLHSIIFKAVEECLDPDDSHFNTMYL